MPEKSTTSNKKSIPLLKSADELKREITFIYYEPNVVDTHGNWANEEVLEKACQNFNKNLASGNITTNLFHTKDDNGDIEETTSYEIQKSWISPTDCIIGETDVIEGTWLVKVKINNDFLWDKFLLGDVSGVSFGAKGSVRAESEIGD